MTRGVLLGLAMLALAGCGGASPPPPAAKPPRIPHALAQTWATQADAVAQALSDGDSCTALKDANDLRNAVAGSMEQIPIRLRATLTSVVETLPGRITCNPAPPAPQPGRHKPPKPPKPPHHHGPGHDHEH
jgi:hypothetical protein